MAPKYTRKSSEDPIPSSPASMPPPMSSPSRRPLSYGLNGQKERRKASITPRKFHRFFEPRSVHSINVGTTRRTLFDITPSANSRNGIRSSPIRRPGDMSGQENSPTPFRRHPKRQKVSHAIAAEEPQVTDDEAASSVFSLEINNGDEDDTFACQDSLDLAPESPCKTYSPPPKIRIPESQIPRIEDLAPDCPGKTYSPPPKIRIPESQIPRIEDRGLSGRMLQLNVGSNSRTRRQHYVYPVTDYQDDTARFHSGPKDVHMFSVDRPNLEAAIPFCTAACNTNTLVAFGDERGQVRMLESGQDKSPALSDPYLAFKPHGNAIIDLSFSQDDTLLASGCGDRRVKVTDMLTQQTIATFEAHDSSVKQVRFQTSSASNSILASSGREGNIFIYDLRCSNAEGPVQSIFGRTDPTLNRGLRVNNIIDAHRPGNQQRGPEFLKYTNSNWATPLERAQWKESTMRPREYGPISITSLAWLPAPQSHLLLSGSELNSSLKLWDVRSIPSRNELAVPLSTTLPPPSHTSHRPVGITSIALSTDGSRIYTPAKDNAIYVYSTAHLISGHAPSLSPTSKSHRPSFTTHHIGPRPLYAYRHPLLLIGSFYIKASIRPARNGNSELLAVGSTDQCALLFPTAEAHLESPAPNQSKYFPPPPIPTSPNARSTTDSNDNNTRTSDLLDFTVRSTPRTRHLRSKRAVMRENGELKMSNRGTPLVEGHAREVSSVAWNSAGELVTVGDDYMARVWREGQPGALGGNRDKARELRTGGVEGGRRWGCGWADVVGDYDDDEV